MKKILTALATSTLLLLASCTKEKSIDSTDPDAPVPPGNSTGSLLVKGVLTTGSDSIVSTYKYDNKGRLSEQAIASSMANAINVNFEITRNSSGQISAYKFSSPALVDLGGGVNYKLQYDADKSQYVNKVMEFEVEPGFQIKDSTVYMYNAQKRITKTERFLRNPFTLEYLKTTIQEYQYNSSGDLVKTVIYYYDEDLDEFIVYMDTSYEYDDNINPLHLGDEGIILETINLYSRHNVKKETVLYPNDPTANRSVSASFTYNGEKKPVSSTITDLLKGGTSTFTYYYN